VGTTVEDAMAIVDSLLNEAPFTATALRTAMEMMNHDPLLNIDEHAYVPLLSLIHGETEAELEQEIEAELAKGYRTFKMKVGFDVGKDLDRVGKIQKVVAGRAQIRVDANQGFSEDDACRFASSMAPDDIELLEQTCAAGDWRAAKNVAKVANVPLMLDESIYGLDDVDRAAELGAASFIKFKLMKAGGVSKLLEALEYIRRRGMTPVLGNGVACDLGCWMEACIAARALDNACEMNGFLKTTACLLKEPIEMVGGEMVLPKAFHPHINQAVVDAHTRNHVQLSA
ncbi:MAG TPA: enolase C-terminal domain-like protein, partial [Gammaproteobacteria bacterium]